MKTITAFIFLFTLAIGCEPEIKPATFKIISAENDYDADISLNYEKANGSSELAKIINSNIESSIIKSLNPETKFENLNSILNEFNEEYLEYKSQFPDESDPKWELYVETEKTYQSDEIISIAINTYEFKGGAHGNDKIKFLNLNAKTGGIIDNANLINDTITLKKIAKTYFIEDLKSQEENLNIEDYFYGKSFQLPENIGYSEEGLIMLYNTYEIASYAKGYTEFVIPFEDVNSIINFN